MSAWEENHLKPPGFPPLGVLVLVAVGGALGSAVRALLIAGDVPAGLLLINVAGSFGLALAYAKVAEAAERLRAFLGPGVFGGFTTFSGASALALESWQQAAIAIAVMPLAAVLGALGGRRL